MEVPARQPPSRKSPPPPEICNTLRETCSVKVSSLCLLPFSLLGLNQHLTTDTRKIYPGPRFGREVSVVVKHGRGHGGWAVWLGLLIPPSTRKYRKCHSATPISGCIFHAQSNMPRAVSQVNPVRLTMETNSQKPTPCQPPNLSI